MKGKITVNPELHTQQKCTSNKVGEVKTFSEKQELEFIASISYAIRYSKDFQAEECDIGKKYFSIYL